MASSVSVSTAEVASSRIRIFGSARMALAMEILCFSPPESERLEAPSSVSYPSGILQMKSWALACTAARMISSLVASGLA